MGVHGLWKLLEAFGEITTPEAWRGKRVAVDASIWLAQFRARAPAAGDSLEQQVLEGFLMRILKLLFYGIHPIFVFDGPASSSKSAEKRRRAMHQEAYHRSILHRRAKQLLAAQMMSGAVTATELHSATEHVAAQSAKTEDHQSSQEKDEEQKPLPPPPPAPPKPVTSVPATRRKRRTERRVPAGGKGVEETSHRLTDAFLGEVETFIREKQRGEACLRGNLLHHSSTSLFMGPRLEVDQEHERLETVKNDPVPEVWVEEESSSSIICSLSMSSVVDDDGSSDESDVISVLNVDESNSPINSDEEDELDWEVPDDAEMPESWLAILNRRSATPCGRASSSGDDGASPSSDEEEEEEESVTGMDALLWNPCTQQAALVCQSEEMRDCAPQVEDDDFTPVKSFVRPSTSSMDEEGNSLAPNPSSGPAVMRSLDFSDGRVSAGHVRRQMTVPYELIGIVDLLDCLGIGFVLSPTEADAQCAFLSQCGLVDAVFTEDSDVVVHGATVVLRGFFSTNKEVVAFNQRHLQRSGLTKEVLVSLAVYLGNDYAEGVAGMGIASALRAISTSWLPAEVCERVPEKHVYAMISRWHRMTGEPIPASWCDGDEHLSMLQFWLLLRHHDEWKTLSCPPGVFPASAVIRAFFLPVVDRDTTPFPPLRPDWQRVKAFASARGILASTWVRQRFDLARAECERRAAASESSGGARQVTIMEALAQRAQPMDGGGGAPQRMLKNLSISYALALSLLRDVQATSVQGQSR